MISQLKQSSLDKLVQPLAGLISRVVQLPNHPGDPRFPILSSSLGDVGQAIVTVKQSITDRQTVGGLDGAGGGLDYEAGKIRAIAEGLERYSSCVYADKQFIWATAEELGDEALDLDTLPRCSETELAHPRCPISAPNKQAPMRWVRAISLLNGRPVWVPAVMAYLYIPFLSPGERIMFPISTGCAAHSSLEQALVGAICEVLERDAISLTWLQQLQLPRIELDQVPVGLQPYLECNKLRNSGLQNIFFDATTDMGVPTVYSLHLSPQNDKLAMLVMCSTELDPATAIAKVIRESASSRIAMQVPREIPAKWDDFIDVFHGAVYMGRRERLPAFDFLLNSPHRRRLSEMPVISTGDPRQDLTNLMERFRKRKLDVFVVDLTTDEALRVGMHVVRVLIPSLQPLSFTYRARYLAHPRLYDAPRRMGYPVGTESDINIWPQPFA